MTALEALTPIQREAVVATATAYLVDPEELAAEWAYLLLDPSADPVTPAAAGAERGVNDPLTPASAEPVTYAVSFTTAPPSTWSNS